MPTTITPLLHYLRRLAIPPDNASDAGLLARFARTRDEAAFAALVARHGPMVLNVCRRILGDAHAAEDAFQAAFLVLARKAGSLYRPEALTGWLYGVAVRVARKARDEKTRSRDFKELAGTTDHADPHPNPLATLTAREVLAILEEELQHLPEAYRLPVALCCLEGLSQEEAAQRLGWTAGSVKGRLERGRKRLRDRLAKRGLTLTATLAVAEFVRGASPTRPAATLLAATVRLAQTSVSGQTTIGIPDKVAALAAGVCKAMWIKKMKIVAAILLTLTVFLGGVAFLSSPTPAIEQAEGPAAQPGKALPPPAEQPKSDRDLLQGKWQLIKVNANGKHLAHHTSDQQLWEFNGDRLTIHYGKEGEREEFVCKLASTKKPKAIDLQLIQGKLNPVIYLGIFAFEGEELKICRQNGDRPTDFTIGEEDRGKILFVLKRVKQEEDKKMAVADWSKEVKGLQGRLVYGGILKNKFRNDIQIGLELKNSASKALAVKNDPNGLKWELLDAKGKPCPGAGHIIDGSELLPSWAVLPPNTYLGFSLYDNRVSPLEKGTLLSLHPDGHAWVLKPGEYTLRATFTFDPDQKDAPKDAWVGKLELPPLKIVVQ